MALQAASPAGWSLVACSRAELDISAEDAVAQAFRRHQPALVVNAAAYTAVDRAEEEEAAAYRANADGPGVLARMCHEHDARLIHISTDFVFDGLASQPYETSAATNPLGVYGQSKWLGEEAVRGALPAHVILRSGWVYSHRGANFLQTMMRLHREQDSIRVVADQVGTPTRAESLARAVWAAAALPELAGTFHWSDAGVCSWYDFAVAIGRAAKSRGLIDSAARVEPISSSEYPTAAKRPPYSVLDKRTAWAALGQTSRHWQEELDEAMSCMGKNDNG